MKKTCATIQCSNKANCDWTDAHKHWRWMVRTRVLRRGFRVIRNLGSHGTGRALHEAPEHIPGHYVAHDNRTLHEGMVITVEPFLATHCNRVEDAGDGWSLVCPKGFGAQFEHTLVVTAGEPIVVT